MAPTLGDDEPLALPPLLADCALDVSSGACELLVLEATAEGETDAVVSTTFVELQCVKVLLSLAKLSFVIV